MASTTPPTSINTTENMETKVFNMLAETYPNLDCGPGTPVYEMVVRPIAMLWTRQAQGIEELTKSMDLSNFAQMNEEDLERLVSRYFVARRGGYYVTGIARIMFANAIDVNIYAGDILEASNERLYEVISDHFLSAADLGGDIVNGYYYDVAVRSIGTGSKYNARVNDALTVTGGAQPYYTRAYFVSDTSDGGIIESNYDLFNRTADELGRRGLFSYKSAVADIRANFPTILEVLPVGIRDDEMLRDLVHIRGYGVDPEEPYGQCHIGGKCDIYIKPNLYFEADGYRAPLGFPMSYTETDVDAEDYGVTYSLADTPDSLMIKWNSLGLTPRNPYFRGSTKEEIPLLSVAHPMKSLTSDLNALDAYVNASTNTLLHTDNLVKQKFPIVVRISVKIADADADEAVAKAKTVIAQYVNSLSTSQAPSNTEIIYLLRESGIDVVHLPVYIDAYYLTDDTLEIQRISLGYCEACRNTIDASIETESKAYEVQRRVPEDSLLVPIAEDNLKFIIEDVSQMSLRTCCWYTNEDLIKIEVTSE